MSCHIIDSHVIDGLLTHIQRVAHEVGNPFSQSDLNQMGIAIAYQNARSWNARYPRDAIKQLDGYRFRQHTAIPADPWHVISACDYVEHQCNETRDWETTPACRIVQRIKRITMIKLKLNPDSDSYRDTATYRAAPWGMVENPNRSAAA
jgi:hypothetical protein